MSIVKNHLAFMLLLAATALAQRPNVINSRFEEHPLNGPLDREIQRLTAAGSQPNWIAYTAALTPGQHDMCGWNSDLPSRQSRVELEGPQTMVILIRTADTKIDKLQTYTTNCEIDAGGMPFHLLANVPPAESVRYLASLVPQQRRAIMAIALHADAAADDALTRLTAPSNPEKAREEAAFWIGTARGVRGTQTLKNLLAGDPSERVREKCILALSLSKDPAATDLLINYARNDRTPKVRERALFWLAQKAGKKEAEVIGRAIAEDPDTNVKKQAVFALYQMPRDQGVPLLIQIARTSPNPEVRKQAIFWLGQSKDERALRYFEEVLNRR